MEYEAVNNCSREEATRVFDVSLPQRKQAGQRPPQQQLQSPAALPTNLAAEDFIKWQARLDRVEKELSLLKTTTLTEIGERATDAIRVANEAKNIATNTENRIKRKHSKVTNVLSRLTDFHLKEAKLMRSGFISVVKAAIPAVDAQDPSQSLPGFPLELLLDPSLVEAHQEEEDYDKDEDWSTDSPGSEPEQEMDEDYEENPRLTTCLNDE